MADTSHGETADAVRVRVTMPVILSEFPGK